MVAGASVCGNILGNAANVTRMVGVANGGTGTNSRAGYVLAAGTGESS
jgi:hypothetical protein